jgi:hypothetical protein
MPFFYMIPACIETAKVPGAVSVHRLRGRKTGPDGRRRIGCLSRQLLDPLRGQKKGDAGGQGALAGFVAAYLIPVLLRAVLLLMVEFPVMAEGEIPHFAGGGEFVVVVCHGSSPLLMVKYCKTKTYDRFRVRPEAEIDNGGASARANLPCRETLRGKF